MGGAPELYQRLSDVLGIKQSIDPGRATVIYSSDGVVLARVFRENRTYVSLKDIPESLKNATIAIEDSRFYEHGGLDAKGIARAVWRDVKGHKLAEGGSTLTQQLVRSVCLTQRKTFTRKVKESFLALSVERKLSKDEILELYLNQVYYGSGAYGVEAASETYFGKPVSRLKLSEAALIAGLPQRPSGYSPHQNLKAAINRRDIVLNRMAELGYITAQERDRAKRARPRIVPKITDPSGYKAPHFVAYVLKQLHEKYSDDVLRNGGLNVYTTLDYKMQKAAERALRSGVRSQSRALNVGEGCLVCIEPETGYIRAMVGSVDPKSEFNRCTGGFGRQPGSSFKLFVYAAALEAGMKPSDKILDAPVSYPGADGHPWTPTNDDNKFHGWVTMETAIAQSMNIPAIKVADKVGINNVIRMARLAGVNSDLEPALTTAIGGIKGVHPLEMASAYATFANDGVSVPPSAIVRVTNWRGETVDEFSPKGHRAISSEVCKEMDGMLRQVVVGVGGTGHVARDVPEARGKTGTTNDDRDAWFIGYVPGKLVTACWVGNDNNAPMRHVFGGSVCAPIWRKFMLQALPEYDRVASKRHISVPVEEQASEPTAEKPKLSEPLVTVEPETTTTDDQQSDIVTCTVCDESGQLATPNCPSTHSEQYEKGTEPTQKCTIHSDTIPKDQDEPTDNTDSSQ